MVMRSGLPSTLVRSYLGTASPGALSEMVGTSRANMTRLLEELIDDGKGWLDMIIERIKFNPLYTEDFQVEFAEKIAKKYISNSLSFSSGEPGCNKSITSGKLICNKHWSAGD